jgi:hypothetical protein
MLKFSANFFQKFSDVAFILEGQKEIPAHKLLLARCPYFAAMFSMEMKEKTMDKIRIENVSYHIFLLVLRYLYTDDCEITLEVFFFALNDEIIELHGTI